MHHYQSGWCCLHKRLHLDQIALQVLFFLEAFLRIGPDQPDDLAGDELRVEAEERRHPGERLPLVRGRPDVPAEQVVQQEWHEHQRSPDVVWIPFCRICIFSIAVASLFSCTEVESIADGITFSRVELDEHRHIRVDVNGWQGNVQEAKDHGLLDLLASAGCLV